MYYKQSFPNSVNIPNDDVIMDTIRKYGKDELQKLLDEDTKLMELISSSSQIVTMQKRKEQLLHENSEIANKNKSYEPALNNHKQELIAEYNNLRKLQQKNEELRSKLESYEDKYSPHSILALFLAGMAESEEQSENCAGEFMDKKIDIDSFINKFLEERNRYHERRIKGDQLQDIINNKTDTFMNNYSNYQQQFVSNVNVKSIPQPNVGFKY